MKRLTRNSLASAAVIAATLLAIATPTATADTSTLGLGCFVDSPRLDPLTLGHCAVRHPAPSYTVYFEVLGRSAGEYTYHWQVTGLPIVDGCTSSSPSCTLAVRSARRDKTVTMSVVVTELATGASTTVTADAEFVAVCGEFFC